jgi:hypothetical protein
MRLGLSAMVLALSAAACPAMAQDRLGLAPSVPWTLDYDDDSCALRRMFGSGDDQAYLEMRRFGPGLILQTIIGHSRMDARQPVNFTYRFDSDPEWHDVSGSNTVTLANDFSGVLFDPYFVRLPGYDELEDPAERVEYLRTLDLRAIEKEAASRTNSITLRGAFRRELTLQLGNLEAPIAALNACIDELMTHWNIDVEAHKTLTRAVTPVNLSEVGRMIDYPPKMIQRNMQGVVNIRLDVDETGRITGCHIQMPLSDPAFEETSCVDIQHALDFDPALDRDGKPIASYWITKVHFSLN